MSATDMFAAPVQRGMKVLDRSLFKKTIPSSAARIFNNKNIAKCRKELTASHDTLPNNRFDPIRADPDAERAQKGGKCLVLRPEVVHDGESRTARDTLHTE
jgi:tRNA (guanine37-N1)-methyltransferase